MDFNKSKTKENLARLFAGECQDGARYQFLSKTAKAQGFMYISDTMKILAKNEMAHASVIYDMLLAHSGNDTKNIEIAAGYPFEQCSLEKGLKGCSGAELSQARNVYPHFAKIAKDEGFADISEKLSLIAEVEYEHSVILATLDKLYNTKKLYKSTQAKIWKCSNCGNEKNPNKHGKNVHFVLIRKDMWKLTLVIAIAKIWIVNAKKKMYKSKRFVHLFWIVLGSSRIYFTAPDCCLQLLL